MTADRSLRANNPSSMEMRWVAMSPVTTADCFKSTRSLVGRLLLRSIHAPDSSGTCNRSPLRHSERTPSPKGASKRAFSHPKPTQNPDRLVHRGRFDLFRLARPGTAVPGIRGSFQCHVENAAAT